MLTTILLALALQADAKPPAHDVWPGKPPGVIAATGEEKDTTKPDGGLVAGRRVIRLGNVSKPTLTVYKPPKEKDTGASVIVCPGGAYHILALDLEGTEVCEWLNSIGITGVLLKYRVPRPKEGGYYLPALMDAQRAVSLTRSHAKEWGLDPKKIGILGFSAGGHLAATTATNFDKRSYEPVDAADKTSCRPDFTLLIYPGYLVDKQATKLNDEIRVTRETPPTFFAHAHDDGVTPASSAMMYLALKKAGVPAELHVWESGGHGYGLRRTAKPVTRWPERAEEWLRQRGVIPQPPRVPKQDSGEAWKRLPLKGPGVGKPLPEWARALVETMPTTTAAMLELDKKHRRDNPLGARLAAKVRLAAATANECDWTRLMAEEDLRRAGGSDGDPEDERRILNFARMLTLAAYSITDEEVADLRKRLGDAKLVALVQLVAHANFQDRIVLSLGVGGPVTPPLDVTLDPTRKPIAPARKPPEQPPSFAIVERPDWEPIDFADLKKNMEKQKARPERVRVPTWEEYKKTLPPGAPVPERPLRIKWSLVCGGHQPGLAAGWSACTRSYGEEAKPDRVLDESLFWVVTRSLTCFY